jgi:hypothetical protein
MKNEIIKQAAKYGTFEFRDQYIADQTENLLKSYLKDYKEKNGKDAEGDDLEKLKEEAGKNALKKYQEDFCGSNEKNNYAYDYLYNFYILNYPVIYLTNIYTQFFFTNIPFK